MAANTGDIFKKVFILLLLGIGGIMIAGAAGLLNVDTGLFIFVLVIMLILLVGFQLAFSIGPAKLDKQDWVIVVLLIASIIALFYFKIIPIPNAQSIIAFEQIQSIVGG